ncbi:NAD(P)/FAD-dependent oxidoreductase [Chondromyces crocatus]|uniref:Ferredoxin reductase n=1 Tax=Chondromyces crocatus TaxID=52 RepID=A0A0K1EFK3_CHOCO|nr:FAD-dependent oxidoreductase [Chondromyces crocatus]AKT39477.1 ferredoxin reductase [Chondromyces crocatus]
MTLADATKPGATRDRVVIVGASLAGLRAAEALRRAGFTGQLTLLGDEPHQPYDRPPLSKQVLAGSMPVEHTALARFHELDAQWRLGVRATGLSLADQHVHLADGQRVGFDRLIIATGARARPFPHPEQAALDGVFVLRSRDDASRLRARLDARPRRVLILGGGFIGSEVASVCRRLDLQVTVVERGPAPLANALGDVIGAIAATVQRKHGVDLRCGVTVTALEGDAQGRLQRAHLSDGEVLDVDLALIAIGPLRNTEWLTGSGLAADARGVVCDAHCRALDERGAAQENVFAAGDVARWPHPLYPDELLAVEHWSNAVEQARTAAHNAAQARGTSTPLRAHTLLPTFWSHQFGINIKSTGVPPLADAVIITQGSTEAHSFVAAYGQRGRIIAAVTFDQARMLPVYQAMIEASAPLPVALGASDEPHDAMAVPAGFSPIPQPGPTLATPPRTPAERAAVGEEPVQPPAARPTASDADRPPPTPA